ncbi:unnamed protein product [Anisakis simplex]|uniref:H15 domain-containing protein n=1 Tax=Anisakis simplex TaxID=6269 RepID=A0A0M3K3B0_ANISI|nr:unnamed protein product [Anisakis simplex]
MTTSASPKPKSPSKKVTSPSKLKKSSSKLSSSHPTYSAMVKSAVAALKEPKGSSRAAILKYIVQHYKVGENIPKVNAHLRQALKKGAMSGVLKQTKGTGASGSFRLGDKAVKKTVKRVKKSPTKKVATKKPGAAAMSQSAKKLNILNIYVDINECALQANPTKKAKKAAGSPKKPKVKKSPAKAKKARANNLKKAAKSPSKTKTTHKKMVKKPVVKKTKA